MAGNINKSHGYFWIYYSEISIYSLISDYWYSWNDSFAVPDTSLKELNLDRTGIKIWYITDKL